MEKWRIEVSEKLKNDMDFYSDINWSAVVEKEIRRKLKILKGIRTTNHKKIAENFKKTRK